MTKVGWLIQMLVLVMFAGCSEDNKAASDSGTKYTSDAAMALDCAPIGAPGSERRCPSGCEIIEGLALVWNKASDCLRLADSNGIRPGRPVVAGCAGPGDHVRSGQLSCYTAGGDSFFIRTDAIYPELLEQDWMRCSPNVAGHVADRMCGANASARNDAGTNEIDGGTDSDAGR